ncbi:DNA-directed DNA polymerase II large subunit [Haloglomus halophilum]|uniref:DNA-directed DNA polymerase II large subunit n=1 Tax=Haloglomus halophilum TaxID=2962672 RepID=UPI0020C94FD2|nr:DNA-directed DNA polymerase II large subunit [Haloglomus halophilum]
MREADERYFERIEDQLDDAFAAARAAKERGGDPSTEIEIPVAKDMADRVENILGIDGVAERVRELEGEMSREEAALELVTDFVDGNVGDYDGRAGKVEGAVRTAVALLTEGVVAAPIEGIDRVELLENDDGTEFVNVYYAGPIRSAGGTAQALSVLVADYARSLLGIEEYRARDAEVERYAEEIGLYDKETGLQYTPKDPETKFIAENLPIMLDGEATGDEEVSGFRDLDRVDTNNARGGMCLVLAEGIALKAPKIQRYTRGLDEVDWPWLQDLIDGNYKDETGDGDEGDEAEADDGDEADEADDDAEDAADEPAGPPRVEKSKKFLRDLIAGRPVFGHPSEAGGFRLRYGRARNHGFATAGVHPATMHLVDDFLATGTQIKTERPGKAAGVVPVDSIEGPTVKLANGEVRRVDDTEEAKEIRNGVDAILDLGEYLVNYGEFVENNHPLAPASYTVEWWTHEMRDSEADVQALEDDPHVDLAHPSAAQALEWATTYDAPLHPTYTPCWHDISVEALDALATAAGEGSWAEADGLAMPDDDAGPGGRDVPDGEGRTLVLPRSDPVTQALEALLVEHTQGEDTLTVPDALPLVRSLGLTEGLERTWTLDDLPSEAREYDGGDNAIEAANAVAPFALRERAPTRIGARMGRPEKSESRDLSPAVHTLFPIGEAGGSQRSFADAAKYAPTMEHPQGRVDVELARRECPDCRTETFRARCQDCNTVTEAVYVCPDCDSEVEPDESGRAECPRCETLASPTQYVTLDANSEYRGAMESVKERENAFGTLKAVKGLTSEEKVPEPVEKGILRAKNGVSVFKDGTVRYDMTDLPVTSVRPEELDVTAEDFRELGYDEDIDGQPLRHDDQLVELKVQDIVLSDGAAEHMLRTADFVDDLLTQYYGTEPFYDVDERQDLVGELVFGMAPHTSAAVVGRVVGFTSAAVGYAHPYFHAAKRRNCFHPETEIVYEDGDGRQRASIRSFVEKRLEDPETDDFGTLVQELDGEVTVPSIDADGNRVVRAVEAVSKHPAPDHLLRIETEAGRSIQVTPDHSMLRLEDGPTKIPASELELGDEVPVPSETMAGTSGTDAGVPLADGGGVVSDTVDRIEFAESDVDHVYCLTVDETNALIAEDLLVSQCDGDEDCVMLLMDGLLNFSRKYLPNQRGGRMDAPLVMSSRIDPSEIDDEAHNMDIVTSYPREFYEATREMADPEEVDVQIAESTLGTDEEYRGFDHTHDTTDIALGPDLSAYKTLDDMDKKMDGQLELARKIRAVDETDVAERIIEYHFLPDLIGNLRAFSRQETRCRDCGEKYRRMPLSGDCRECGGEVSLTVYQGSVNKYMDTARRVAEEYGARPYTKQRLEILNKALESIFENDHNKQSGIADFM